VNLLSFLIYFYFFTVLGEYAVSLYQTVNLNTNCSDTFFLLCRFKYVSFNKLFMVNILYKCVVIVFDFRGVDIISEVRGTEMSGLIAALI